MFTSDNGGLLLNEILPIEIHCEGNVDWKNANIISIISLLGLIGIAAPMLYFSKKVSV